MMNIRVAPIIHTMSRAKQAILGGIWTRQLSTIVVQEVLNRLVVATSSDDLDMTSSNSSLHTSADHDTSSSDHLL
ncbi:hypothetical protein DPSP01_006905 [Paraphaeosphaeria sporulosa]